MGFLFLDERAQAEREVQRLQQKEMMGDAIVGQVYASSQQIAATASRIPGADIIPFAILQRVTPRGVYLSLGRICE